MAEAVITYSNLYDQCTIARQDSVKSVELYDFETRKRGFSTTEAFYPIFCKTEDFKNPSDLIGKITLHDPTGQPGRTLEIGRDWSNIWPLLPSTIFTPDGSNTFGVLLVKESFFVSEEERLQLSRPRTKWPRRFGNLVSVKDLLSSLYGEDFAQLVIRAARRSPSRVTSEEDDG